MKQIFEDYVSYEIAKLLKEKGFDIHVQRVYSNKGSTCETYCNYNNKYKYHDWLYPCASQSLALKWLREVHNTHITIKPYITVEGIMYLFEIYKLEAEKFTLIKTKTGFEKSELANEAALKYTLENLI